MMREYRMAFIERLARTPTAMSYRFQRPVGLDFDAGQYMLVDLGNGLVHPLSFSDCPGESGFVEFTKRLTGSPYCRRLESLRQGEEIAARGPAGHFCSDDSDSMLVMIAGGIGITPLRSILRERERKQQKGRPIILFYGNMHREDIAFREELEGLRLADYRIVHVLTDTTGMEKARKGFISAEIIADEVSRPATAFYMVSGPPVMVEAMRQVLAALAVPEEQSCYDLFLGY